MGIETNQQHFVKGHNWWGKKKIRCLIPLFYAILEKGMKLEQCMTFKPMARDNEVFLGLFSLIFLFCEVSTLVNCLNQVDTPNSRSLSSL